MEHFLVFQYFSSVPHIIENHRSVPLVLIDGQNTTKDTTKLSYPVRPHDWNTDDLWTPQPLFATKANGHNVSFSDFPFLHCWKSKRPSVSCTATPKTNTAASGSFIVFNVELVKSALKITQRDRDALAHSNRYTKQRQQKYKVALIKLFFALQCFQSWHQRRFHYHMINHIMLARSRTCGQKFRGTWWNSAGIFLNRTYIWKINLASFLYICTESYWLSGSVW